MRANEICRSIKEFFFIKLDEFSTVGNRNESKKKITLKWVDAFLDNGD